MATLFAGCGARNKGEAVTFEYGDQLLLEDYIQGSTRVLTSAEMIVQLPFCKSGLG